MTDPEKIKKFNRAMATRQRKIDQKKRRQEKQKPGR